MAHQVDEDLLCMICCKPANDAIEHEIGKWFGTEENWLYWFGMEETWVYCASCDCWTAHPDKEKS